MAETISKEGNYVKITRTTEERVSIDSLIQQRAQLQKQIDALNVKISQAEGLGIKTASVLQAERVSQINLR